ncbi:PD-(D/E)XK nuclease family protein [Aggregicoccus sp. 17bor-14]|uniref:PD-(D/E)XK nuclease family protein n=1 Tax=Myxococcaceae TaxID=31 RepID=UPI00129CBF3A|nr:MULTISPECIES: UrvD/REP family ATP-dependent DNA helicase [Myxococcaceae]MBF5041473.1 PD-(D/E)XK nuclease family protein [Simulacricoccus sp. 17bor-14]MRI87257.1 PD-(D/E)XK nuclease family protein [Aggregicoccus sp. 17bor-14]
MLSSAAQFLQVHPDAARLRAAVRARPGLHPGVRHATWEDFLGELAGARLLGRRACSPLEARTLLATEAAALGPTRFGASLHEPAFARAALEAVLALKGARLGAAALQDAIEALAPERQPRLRTLARLYDGYEHRLEALGLADREDVLRGARLGLEQGRWPEAWRGLRRLQLTGVYDAPPSVLALLLALAQACDRRGAVLEVELPPGGSAAADAALAPVFRAFERLGEASGHVELAKADVSFERRPFAPLARALFDLRAAPGSLRPEGALSLWSAGSAQEEARLVAREVRRILLEGTAPESIAVAARAPGPELQAVAEALRELGVAVLAPHAEPLEQAGAVRLALELPLLVEEGFPVERVAALLDARYAAALVAHGPEAPATLLSEAGVRDDRVGALGARGAYEVRLEALARRHAREPLRAHAVRLLKERCLRLIALVRALPAEGPAAELLEAWWACVRALGLTDTEGPFEPSALGALALDARARDDAARAALELRVAELRRALALSGGGPRLTRAALARWLRASVRDVRLPARGEAARAVELLEVGALGGRSFEHLFVMGLQEGHFPRRGAPNPVLGDSERAELNRLLGREAFRLTGGEFEERTVWQLAEDRLLFAGALAASTGTLTLSHAVASPGGQEQPASPFLEEVERLSGLRALPRTLAPIPALGEVLTEGELRQRVALEALAPVRLRASAPHPAAALWARRFAQEPWFEEARAHAAAEEERLRFFGEPSRAPGPFSGAVDAEDLRTVLEAMFSFSAERPLSASTLGRFGNCAFRGLLSYGLRIPEPPLAPEELDPRARGTFWHKVMEELFARLAAEGLLGRPLEEVPEALLDAALEAAAGAIVSRGPVGHPALWRLARERARAMARRILSRAPRGLPFPALTPEAFELKFGPGAPDPAWAQVGLEGEGGEAPIHFEGKIDRLDTGAEVGVLDYKSGLLDSPRELREQLLSTDFQLPLYLFAARASGRERARRAGWLSLRTGETTYLSELLSDAELEDLLSTDPAVRARVAQEGGLNLSNAVRDLVRSLRQGRFPARPKACGDCGYRAVCRISARRLPAGEEAP